MAYFDGDSESVTTLVGAPGSLKILVELLNDLDEVLLGHSDLFYDVILVLFELVQLLQAFLNFVLRHCVVMAIENVVLES